jgi:hypothetical protein
MSDQPSRSSLRIWVLRGAGLPLEERTVELALEPIVIDDTPDRQSLFFAFDGPGVLGLRAESTGKQDRRIAGEADAITDRGPISAWIESVGI